MSSDGDFHLTLPSNTITHIFDDKNTSSNYEIPLPTPIEFGEATCEVALTAILFPHTWYNIPEEMRTLAFQWMLGREHGTDVAFRERKIRLGHYETPELLVRAIDSSKPKEFHGSIFVIPVNNLVHVSMPSCHGLWVDKRLALLLRFRSTLSLNQPLIREKHQFVVFDHLRRKQAKIYRAKNMCDPDPSMHVIYIYCSVIKENLVGAQYSPLLRVVPTNGRHGRIIHVSFDNPQYIEVTYDRISSIKLTLCNDQGEPIKFTAGKTICRLHFRPKYRSLR